jgi:hypothetical protein
MHDQFAIDTPANIETPEDSEQESPEIANDIYIYRELRTLLEQMTCPQKMAVGLYAYWLTDTTIGQLCELRPRYGEFPPEVDEAIALVKQLHNASLAEVANEILLEDWIVEPSDAPSTIIE